MAKRFSPINSKDEVLNRIQDGLVRSLNPVFLNPLINGVLLPEVVLASGQNVISHKLERKLIGWFIVRLRANETIYDTQDSNLIPDKTLILQASGPVTVDIYCF